MTCGGCSGSVETNIYSSYIPLLDIIYSGGVLNGVCYDTTGTCIMQWPCVAYGEIEFKDKGSNKNFALYSGMIQVGQPISFTYIGQIPSSGSTTAIVDGSLINCGDDMVFKVYDTSSDPNTLAAMIALRCGECAE